MSALWIDALANVEPGSLSRRDALRRLNAAVLAPSLATTWMSERAAAQGEVVEVGRAPAGQLAFQLVGTIEQRGFDFIAYGFLMHVANLDPAQLFTDDDTFNRSPATARLTFHASAAASARTVHHPLFVVTADGTLNIIVNEAGGATFEEPESFAAGTRVATAALTVHNVVNVFAPQLGTVSGSAELTLETSDTFTLGETEYRFGEAGMAARLSLAGQGSLLDPTMPEALIRFVGDAVTGA